MWAQYGQAPSEFQNLTIREILLVCEGASLRDATQAWLVASYSKFAFHEPQNMPERPSEVREEGVNTEKELAEVKAWMRYVAGKSNGS